MNVSPLVPQPVAGNQDRVIPIVRGLAGASFGRRQDIRPAQISMTVDGGKLPADELPVCDLLVGDLSIRYAIDGERTLLNVTPAMLREVGLKRDALLTAGIANLHRLYPEAEVMRGDGVAMVVKSGDLESSWMLDFAFWAAEAQRFEGELIASVPARDVMVWADAARPELVEMLRSKGLEVHAKETASKSNRAISTHLFAWRDGGWELYELPAAP